MRRALLAAALGGLLLSGAGCSGDDAETASEAPQLVVPSTAAAATSPAPDYSANTRTVCAKLDKIFDTELQAFGTELGKMIAYKEAKQATEATEAEKDAAAQLKDVSAQVRKETGAAQDPEIKDAGAQSAAKLSKSAADGAFFDQIKTTKDLDKILETRMTDWLSPIAGRCA